MVLWVSQAGGAQAGRSLRGPRGVFLTFPVIKELVWLHMKFLHRAAVFVLLHGSGRRCDEHTERLPGSPPHPQGRCCCRGRMLWSRVVPQPSSRSTLLTLRPQHPLHPSQLQATAGKEGTAREEEAPAAEKPAHKGRILPQLAPAPKRAGFNSASPPTAILDS